ncbi:hypothetical protein BU17DRAFT_93896 [Hysterangium stoloniferum]|nr:hypothetical protein BU17DRAFT_93896 [Hysterangium stoloniferum]
MQFTRLSAIFGLAALLSIMPHVTVAQTCCNSALPACPTPPLNPKFGHGPECCPGNAPRC